MLLVLVPSLLRCDFSGALEFIEPNLAECNFSALDALRTATADVNVTEVEEEEGRAASTNDDDLLNTHLSRFYWSLSPCTPVSVNH